MQTDTNSEFNDVLEQAKLFAERNSLSVNEVIRRAVDLFCAMDAIARIREEHEVYLKREGITVPDYTEEDIVRFVKEVREERRLAEANRR